MNELKRQIRRAHRRMLMQHFLNVLPWTLSSCLLIATAAIATTKIWALPVDPTQWALGWLAGALLVGGLAAALATRLRQRGELGAAIEIDDRFGLRERVSSCLTLSEEEQNSAAGQALIQDAARRVERIEVPARFGLTTNRWAALPCAMAVLAFGLTLLSDAQPNANGSSASAAVNKKEKKVVANSTKKLVKQSEQLRKKAKKQGLKEASDLFKKLEAGVDSLKKKQDVDRKQAMVKLNDLAKQMQKRQAELLDRDGVRKQLNSLKNMKSGPADRMVRAMKQGNFKLAMKELNKLQEALKDTQKMSAAEKQQLQEQLEQMRDKLQQMADAHQQAKSKLQQQIQQKLAQGDRQAASKLQNQLDQLMQQEKQAQKLSDMAASLGQAADALQQGDSQQAAQSLGQMAESLEAMGQEMAEMEMLESAMGQISAAKDAMNCSSCQGMGCSMCQGMGMNEMMGSMQNSQGRGIGDGTGRGNPPEEELQHGTYDSQVRAKPGKGRAVTVGTAFGHNRPGEALEEIKSAIEAAQSGEEDPLTRRRLPKPQRELTREYFRAMTE